MAQGFIRLGEEYLTRIGKITVYFNVLEWEVTTCIWYLIEVLMKCDPHVIDHRVGQMITAELSFQRKIALLSSLYRHMSDVAGGPHELRGLLKRVAQAEGRRNEVVHSFWGGSIKPGTISRVKVTAKRRAGLTVQFQQMTVQELDEIADFIESVAYDVALFLTHDPLILRRWG